MALSCAVVNVENSVPVPAVHLEAVIPAAQIVMTHPKRAVQTVERDPTTLEITVGVTIRYPDLRPAHAPPPDSIEPLEPALTGSDDEIAAGLAAHAAVGASHLIAALEPTTPASVDRLAAAVRLAGPALD